jgi:hypothetical protein
LDVAPRASAVKQSSGACESILDPSAVSKIELAGRLLRRVIKIGATVGFEADASASAGAPVLRIIFSPEDAE